MSFKFGFNFCLDPDLLVGFKSSLVPSFLAFHISKREERKNGRGKGKRRKKKSIMTPYYYDSPKKKPIHPMYCIYPFIIHPIYLPILLQQFLLVFYIYSPCIALSFIHLLYFNYIPLLHLIPILFNNLNISFTSKCVFLILFF